MQSLAKLGASLRAWSSHNPTSSWHAPMVWPVHWTVCPSNVASMSVLLVFDCSLVLWRPCPVTSPYIFLYFFSHALAHAPDHAPPCPYPLPLNSRCELGSRIPRASRARLSRLAHSFPHGPRQ